jgi:predicted dehydrogenase
VAASDYHVEALQQTIAALRDQGVSDEIIRKKTILMEKPLVSTEAEGRRLQGMFEAGIVDKDCMFVNENYNASRGLAAAISIIDDVPVNQVDVVFFKNRVPDVKKGGRSVSKAGGAYAIEMPHMVSVARQLAGLEPKDQTTIVENRYLRGAGVGNMPESIGNYTVVQAENDVTLRMAQGLGPCEMTADGVITPNSEPAITRYANAYLEDDRRIMLEFDPVPGIARYVSRVSEFDSRGRLANSFEIGDDMLKQVIRTVSEHAFSGVRPAHADVLSVDDAMAVVRELWRYENDARAHGIQL